MREPGSITFQPCAESGQLVIESLLQDRNEPEHSTAFVFATYSCLYLTNYSFNQNRTVLAKGSVVEEMSLGDPRMQWGLHDSSILQSADLLHRRRPESFLRDG